MIFVQLHSHEYDSNCSGNHAHTDIPGPTICSNRSECSYIQRFVFVWIFWLQNYYCLWCVWLWTHGKTALVYCTMTCRVHNERNSTRKNEKIPMMKWKNQRITHKKNTSNNNNNMHGNQKPFKFQILSIISRKMWNLYADVPFWAYVSPSIRLFLSSVFTVYSRNMLFAFWQKTNHLLYGISFHFDERFGVQKNWSRHTITFCCSML